MKIVTRLQTVGIALISLIIVSACGQKKVSEKKSGETMVFMGIRSIPSGDKWNAMEEMMKWNTQETAMVICDMWDRHWCKGATERVGEMAPKINELAEAARKKGVTIIHAPSDVIPFYKDTPQRKRLKSVTIETWATSIPYWYELDTLKEAQLPIDDSDGGCDCLPKCTSGKAWKKQIDAIHIDGQDGISDDGKEILSYFQQKGIKNVIMTGVHVNMCVLGRSFGIRAQKAAGLNVTLVRDLTDAMYNHEMSPFVSHQEGTELVIKHIEKYWSPTTTFRELIQSLK
ncbi:protein-signal peptide and transmembrane prediction [Fulvivirgaceae bacterium BMA12]|uniref:Protein-signal peptide and transmembrane prediction n=1 Tax=Agaribacillus aureus TaxID=3051825 RepID=A0ABT8KZE2_9BACT|nr:protein-signal peptide and transmembrane prediction [Fulvivirgaceae bacterium BMA12]